MEHRDRLLEKMQEVVGDTPMLKSLIMMGQSGVSSRASTSNGRASRYNKALAVSSLDVGDSAA